MKPHTRRGGNHARVLDRGQATVGITTSVATFGREPPHSGTSTQSELTVSADVGSVLRAVGITKSFRRGMWPRRRSFQVLRGVDLELRRGEMVGLVGENGSGKSTLMDILAGASAADGGTLFVTERVGFCPQQPMLYQRLTCDEHLELFGIASGMDPLTIANSAESLYSSLEFARWHDVRVEELSGGTRAKLNLALALLADPDVLLLDEPYASFDWDTYQRFWEIAAERQEVGRSVLVVSHFVTDFERFDRLVELHDGLAVTL